MDAFISSIIDSPEVVAIYQVVRAVAILLDVVFLAVLVYAVTKLMHYRPHFVYDPRKWQRYVKSEKKKTVAKSPAVAAAWKKVEARLKDGSPESLRLAVIEADGVADDAMKRLGLGGDTFADRLGKLGPEKHPSIEPIWEAHRLRNNLVHTPDFQMGASKAEAALQAYEAFLKDIKAL